MHVSLCVMCEVLTETERRHWNSWDWDYRCYELPCAFWDLNPGPLEEQLVFLTAELPLQLLFYFIF